MTATMRTPKATEETNRKDDIDSTESDEEICDRMSSNCQRIFERWAEPLKSVDLIKDHESGAFLLVDCRTRAERKVSMIQGAISLNDLSLDSTLLDKKRPVVTYCTVGYRSGIEARRIKTLLGEEYQVFNLDGILSYTHALEKTVNAPPLVDSDQQPTKHVHTFSKQWDHAHRSYKTHQFGPMTTSLHLANVGIHATLRRMQHALHELFAYCRCFLNE
jgi:rhodanese-related sulfurtransferase